MRGQLPDARMHHQFKCKFPVNSCLNILWVVSFMLLLQAGTLGGPFFNAKLQNGWWLQPLPLGDVPAVATVVLGTWC